MILYIIGFIIISAIINRIRGTNFGRPILSKAVTSLFMGILSGCYAIFLEGYSNMVGIQLGAAIGVGIYLWAVLGWGKGFTAIHGRREVLREKEVTWIDFILNKIIKGKIINLSTEKVKMYGTIWMSLRGLHLYPMFIAVAYITQETLPLFVGATILAQGFVYYLSGKIKNVPEDKAVEVAEYIMGATIGGMITCIV